MTQALLLAAGVAICLLTADSVVRTLIVPRGITSRWSVWITTAVVGGFRFVACRTKTYESRDRLLAPAAPARW